MPHTFYHATMRFGVVVPIQEAGRAKAAGFDFIEEVVPRFLAADQTDETWQGGTLADNSSLPVRAANMLIPGSLKLVGPDVDSIALRNYIQRICERAERTGIRTLVFGSGVARTVPDGFDRKHAKRQILEFLRSAVHFCARHNIMMVCEAMNRDECNIINSLPEALQYVWEVDHPNFQCLLDTFHFWKEQEPIENLHDAMPWMRHVHVADSPMRTPPGISGNCDYRPIFAELKRGKYDGDISIETINYPPILNEMEQSLTALKKQWSDA
jgi:sugar phosphate isomerase/epimerase